MRRFGPFPRQPDPAPVPWTHRVVIHIWVLHSRADGGDKSMTDGRALSGRARIGVTCLVGVVLFLSSPPPVPRRAMADAAAAAAAAAVLVAQRQKKEKKPTVAEARAARLLHAGHPEHFAQP